MPREQINRQRVHDGAAPAAPEPTADGLRFDPDATILSVGWSKESENVQICVDADGDFFRFASDGRDRDTGRSTVWSPPLGRYEINSAIRALRRARDAAYGRDE